MISTREPTFDFALKVIYSQLGNNDIIDNVNFIF
jgi:hypothetical protein